MADMDDAVMVAFEAACEVYAETDDDEAFFLAGVEHGTTEAEKLRGTIRWMAQTFHQAHHQDQDGTWDECRRNTCDAAAQALKVGKHAPEA